MSQGPDAHDVVTVEADGVTVEKRFSADEFPVPAIEFTLRSERDDATKFRLVDYIPEDFAMDRIGFHPEYESEHWTAYQDHRVEYHRRLGPGEQVTTVYGIRTDDPTDGERFLGDPTVSEVDDDADPVGDVEEAIGDDSSRAVRDLLAGDDGGHSELEADPEVAQALVDDEGDEADVDTDPDDESVDDLLDFDGPEESTEADPLGAEADAEADPLGAEADAETDHPPEAADDLLDLDAEPEDEAEEVEAEADEDAEDAPLLEPDDEADEADDEAEPAPESLELDEEASDDGQPVDAAGAPDVDAEADDDAAVNVATAATGVAAGGVAAALAEELRAGTVSEADRETLKAELELDHSTSVDARISRLQSKVEDVTAYSDAMEEFIDENGIASEWMDGLQADLDELSESIDGTWTELDAAAEERESLSDDVASVRKDVVSVDEEVDAVYDELEGLRGEVTETGERLESSLAEVQADLDDLSEEVADEDEAVAEVREELTQIRDDIESVSAMADDELSELRADLASVNEELTEFEEFRERLSSVFGPGGTGPDSGDSDGE